MKNYLLKNKYVILCFILYILFFIQMQNVNMYADDYSIKALFNETNSSLCSIIKQANLNYYQYWSGRLIGHCLVNLVFSFNEIIMYKILNPIFVFLLCFLLAKILNIDLDLKLSKLLFFISLILMGLDILITRDVFYWADACILYLWTFIPALLIIYYLFKCYKNKEKLHWKQFIISIISLIIVNYSMESSMVLLVGIIFFSTLYNLLNKHIDIKIIILCILSICLIIHAYLIPGNQERIAIHSPNGINLIYKVNIFLELLFTRKYICYYIFLISGLIFQKNINKYVTKNRFYKLNIFTFILTLLFILYSTLYNYNIFRINNYYLMPLQLIYLIINIIFLFWYLKNKNIILLFFIISAFASAFCIILILNYDNSRYFINIIISFILLGLYIFFNSNQKEKLMMLIYTNLFIQPLIGTIGIILIATLYFIFKFKTEFILNLLIFIFITCNLYNFTITIIKYYENDKIFEYNINKIENVKKCNNTNTIELKQLKNVLYAYHMPENAEYVIPWYKQYYHLENYNIVWIP